MEWWKMHIVFDIPFILDVAVTSKSSTNQIKAHMVRNQQDAYPYINLALFFFENWLVNEIRTAMSGELLGISKKIISIFKTWQKMVTQFGQFEKLKWPYSSLQFCIFFFLKIYRIVNFFGKIYWSMNSGSQWAGNC